MKKPIFTDGKTIIATICGEMEVDAQFFNWNGIRLAVTQNIRKDGVFRDYGITHPETGLKLPCVSGRNPAATHAEFLKTLPEIEKKVKNQFGKTLKQFLKNAAADKAASIEAARKKRAQGVQS